MLHTDFHRAILPTVAEFHAHYQRIGCPRHCISARGWSRQAIDPLLPAPAHEWLFADDLDALLRHLLQWDARGAAIVWQAFGEEEMQHQDKDAPTGFWKVTGLPDCYNEVLFCRPTVASRYHLMTEEERRADFFNALIDGEVGLLLHFSREEALEMGALVTVMSEPDTVVTQTDTQCTIAVDADNVHAVAAS